MATMQLTPGEQIQLITDILVVDQANSRFSKLHRVCERKQ